MLNALFGFHAQVFCSDANVHAGKSIPVTLQWVSFSCLQDMQRKKKEQQDDFMAIWGRFLEHRLKLYLLMFIHVLNEVKGALRSFGEDNSEF